MTLLKEHPSATIDPAPTSVDAMLSTPPTAVALLESTRQKDKTPQTLQGSIPRTERKCAIARKFGDASETYDSASFLQQWIGADLLKKVVELSNGASFSRALDVGCGTGYLFRQAASQHLHIDAEYGMDLANGMLQTAHRHRPATHWIEGDMESLPFAGGSFPLMISNLAVQWLDSLDVFLNEAARVLSPGGWLAFSTLGPETLKELTQVRQRAGLENTVNPTLAPEQLEYSLQQSSLTPRFLLRQPYLHFHEDAVDLTRALKHLGAQHCSQPTPQRAGLSGRKTWQCLREQSRALYPDGIPARYDTYLVVVQKPQTSTDSGMRQSS